MAEKALKQMSYKASNKQAPCSIAHIILSIPISILRKTSQRILVHKKIRDFKIALSFVRNFFGSDAYAVNWPFSAHALYQGIYRNRK